MHFIFTDLQRGPTRNCSRMMRICALSATLLQRVLWVRGVLWCPAKSFARGSNVVKGWSLHFTRYSFPLCLFTCNQKRTFETVFWNWFQLIVFLIAGWSEHRHLWRIFHCFGIVQNLRKMEGFHGGTPELPGPEGAGVSAGSQNLLGGLRGRHPRLSHQHFWPFRVLVDLRQRWRRNLGVPHCYHRVWGPWEPDIRSLYLAVDLVLCTCLHDHEPGYQCSSPDCSCASNWGVEGECGRAARRVPCDDWHGGVRGDCLVLDRRCCLVCPFLINLLS